MVSPCKRGCCIRDDTGIEQQLEIEVALQDIELAILESDYALTEQTLNLHALTSNRDFSAYTFDKEAIMELLLMPVETLIEASLSPRHASLQALSALKEQLASSTEAGKRFLLRET